MPLKKHQIINYFCTVKVKQDIISFLLSYYINSPLHTKDNIGFFYQHFT